MQIERKSGLPTTTTTEEKGAFDTVSYSMST